MANRAAERRIRLLQARTRAAVPGPLAQLFVAVVCDGCGASLQARTARALARLTAGWDIRSSPPDYCPSCRPTRRVS